MLRLRTLSWLVICAVLLATVAPALPAQAASTTAIIAPTSQDDVVDRIAEIRSEEPDIEDDFSGQDILFETGYDGTTSAYLKSGQLHIAVDEENTIAWSALDQELTDFYMEVDTLHYDGSLDNQFGILARFDEDSNYYLFAASSDGYYTIQIYMDGEWEALIEWTESDTIVTGEGELNVLGLLAEGDSYTFLINDEIVDSVTDDTLSGTTLALNAAAFGEPPIDMAFDNFRLWVIGEAIEEPVRQRPIDPRRGTPTPEPSATPEASAEQTTEPTEEPTVEPTEEVTEEVTEEGTAEPTTEPTTAPTEEVTLRTAAEMEPFLREPLSPGWKSVYALPRIGQLTD